VSTYDILFAMMALKWGLRQAGRAAARAWASLVSGWMVGVGATERPLGPFGLGYGAQGVGLGRRIWRLVPAKEYQGETPIHGDSAPSNRRFM